MQVSGGELISGVLDKAVFGKFGLVHAVQVRRKSPCSTRASQHDRAGQCLMRRGLAFVLPQQSVVVQKSHRLQPALGCCVVGSPHPLVLQVNLDSLAPRCT